MPRDVVLTLSSSSRTEYTGRNLRCSAMVLFLLKSLAASFFFRWVLNWADFLKDSSSSASAASCRTRHG